MPTTTNSIYTIYALFIALIPFNDEYALANTMWNSGASNTKNEQ
jgi:hypothetical protein